jgi:hypothetical protein
MKVMQVVDYQLFVRSISKTNFELRLKFENLLLRLYFMTRFARFLTSTGIKTTEKKP